MKQAFTLIELIVAIVIIGVLSAVAIPQFAGMVNNSKISAEIATATSVQTIVDSTHSDWIINGPNCDFTWGNDKNSSDNTTFDNDIGYPKALGNKLSNVLRESDFIYATDKCVQHCYYGPASNPNGGVTQSKAGKPNIGDYWEYNASNGRFTLVEN